MFRVHRPIIRSIRCWVALSWVARQHPHRTHDLRSGSQDHHPSKNSVQKIICCNSTSNAPDYGRMYPKYVELRKGKVIPLQARCSQEGGCSMTAALEGGEWSAARPGRTLLPGKTILQEAGWAPGPVWTGGKSHRQGGSIPDRPARSQSLYRLSYPTHVELRIYQ